MRIYIYIRSTSPTIAINGVEEEKDSAMAGTSLSAPGPAVASTTPRPSTFEYPSAANPAFVSS